MGRPRTPDDIGKVVARFCSEPAGWITGQATYADGGASLMSSEVPTEIQIGQQRAGASPPPVGSGNVQLSGCI